MGHLEVIAHLRVRPGRLDGVKAQMAELARLTREKDTHTLRYDVFLNEDGTECEVHEVYDSEQGLIEHNQHVFEARGVLFRDDAFDHHMTVYGEISPHLGDLFSQHAERVTKFHLLQGLRTGAPV